MPIKTPIAVQPVFHHDCAEWLCHLGGQRLGALVNWLYWYQRTEIELQALYLCGPPGTGKSMLASALAQFYNGDVCPFDCAGGYYADGLLHTALVVLDEHTYVKRPSDIFRKLLVSDRRVVAQRAKEPVTVTGHYRLLITTGYMAPPPFRDVPTMADLEALLSRVCYISLDNTAADWLSERRGMVLTRDWVTYPDGRPGRLVEYIQWLVYNHVPAQGLGCFKALRPR